MEPFYTLDLLGYHPMTDVSEFKNHGDRFGPLSRVSLVGHGS